MTHTHCSVALPLTHTVSAALGHRLVRKTGSNLTAALDQRSSTRALDLAVRNPPALHRFSRSRRSECRPATLPHPAARCCGIYFLRINIGLLVYSLACCFGLLPSACFLSNSASRRPAIGGQNRTARSRTYSRPALSLHDVGSSSTRRRSGRDRCRAVAVCRHPASLGSFPIHDAVHPADLPL